MNSTENKLAVILFQLGGPDSLSSVEPFLYNLFCDPDIINFPGAFFARKPLAKFIASRRSKNVMQNYKQIGGKSPILELTNAQAIKLEDQLNSHLPTKVFVAMRYWHPLTMEVISELKKEKFHEIILLPLYPQYCKATTESSLNEWHRCFSKLDNSNTPVKTIRSYHNHTLYIEAIVDNINRTYTKFSHLDPRSVDLVFSAHGVPLSLIKAGDPYQQQIEETVKLVIEKGRWKSPHFLCYQSKVGPMKWVKPSLNEMIRDLATQGRKNILVIPIAFVTEHIETLHEINIETRKEAKDLGIEQFEMMPALNNHPKFIQCLTDLVLANI